MCSEPCFQFIHHAQVGGRPFLINTIESVITALFPILIVLETVGENALHPKAMTFKVDTPCTPKVTLIFPFDCPDAIVAPETDQVYV